MGNARALMFDFNGTLSQDEPLLLAIYQRLFARHGRPLSEEQYFSRLAGLSEEAIVGGWLGVDGPLLDSLVAERVDAYAAEAADGATVTEPRARGGSLRGRTGSASPSSRAPSGPRSSPSWRRRGSRRS